MAFVGLSALKRHAPAGAPLRMTAVNGGQKILWSNLMESLLVCEAAQRDAACILSEIRSAIQQRFIQVSSSAPRVPPPSAMKTVCEYAFEEACPINEALVFVRAANRC